MGVIIYICRRRNGPYEVRVVIVHHHLCLRRPAGCEGVGDGDAGGGGTSVLVYTLRRFAAPQNCCALPPHSIPHSFCGASLLDTSSLFPQ